MRALNNYPSVIPTDPPAGGEWRNPLNLARRDPSASLRYARDDKEKIVIQQSKYIKIVVWRRLNFTF